jgi:argininosuccinate lyase
MSPSMRTHAPGGDRRLRHGHRSGRLSGQEGLPFREAHEAVARAVRAAEQRRCDLADLSLAELQAFSPLVAADIYAVLTLEGSLAARDHLGGTAPNQVRAAAARARARLACCNAQASGNPARSAGR